MAKKFNLNIKEYTARNFEKEFADDDACLEWLKNYRFPDGIHCDFCNKVTKHHRLTKKSCYKCDRCGHEVYPTAGTIFHKSSTPLKTWFEAIYWLATTKDGHSAKELQRRTGITYKTAWRMLNRLRSLFPYNAVPLTGEIDDLDEIKFKGIRKGTGLVGTRLL